MHHAVSVPLCDPLPLRDLFQVVCRILMTAEFCKDTIEGLTSAIQKDIKPDLSDQVTQSGYIRMTQTQNRTAISLASHVYVPLRP